MFISIPREFFVPVVFGEGFILNEENNHLELETDIYRESTGKKSVNDNVSKSYLNEGKSIKEKQDIIDEKIEMDENKCGNKTEGESTSNKIIKPGIDNTTNKENTFYMTLKGEEGLQKTCKNYGGIFKELDDEFVENIDIKGCSDK